MLFLNLLSVSFAWDVYCPSVRTTGNKIQCCRDYDDNYNFDLIWWLYFDFIAFRYHGEISLLWETLSFNGKFKKRKLPIWQQLAQKWNWIALMVNRNNIVKKFKSLFILILSLQSQIPDHFFVIIFNECLLAKLQLFRNLIYDVKCIYCILVSLYPLQS